MTGRKSGLRPLPGARRYPFWASPRWPRMRRPPRSISRARRPRRAARRGRARGPARGRHASLRLGRPRDPQADRRSGDAFIPGDRLVARLECSEIAAGLEAILHGWDIEHADGGAPDAEITRERDGYVWSSAVRPKPHLCRLARARRAAHARRVAHPVRGRLPRHRAAPDRRRSRRAARTLERDGLVKRAL